MRTRPSKVWLTGAVVLSLWMAATDVSAQGWRDYDAEGSGIRVGRLELHPGIGAEVGFDNNVFYESDNLDSAAILRMTAHLDLSTIGAERATEGEAAEDNGAMVEFRGGLEGSLHHYLSGRLSDTARDRLSGGGDLELMINPHGLFTVRLHERFKRTIRPFTDPNRESGEVLAYGRNNNDAGVEFLIKSRGDVLKGRVGYTHHFEFFDDNDFNYANQYAHTIDGGLSWRFFPSTALLYETEVRIAGFPNDADVAIAPSLVTDNITVSNRIGVNGAITDTFSLSAMIGYEAGFYDQADDYDSVSGRAEVRWHPRPTTNFALGYRRRFSPSLIGNFTSEHRIYLNSQLLLIDRVLLGSKLWVSFDKSGSTLRPDITPLGNDIKRKDIRGFASLYTEFRLTDWFAITGEVSYAIDITDFDFNTANSPPLVDPPGDYSKIEAWIGARVFY